MDFLGEKGEDAFEALGNLSERVEDLESHLNAVDGAVQDLREESDESLESLEVEFEAIEKNRSRVIELEELLKDLADVQASSLKEIQANRSRQSRIKADIDSRLDSLESKVDRIHRNQEEVESLLESLEEKVFRVEEELNEDIELNRARIESKISESSHEDDLKQLRKEFSRIKASVNALADDLDDDKIRVE